MDSKHIIFIVTIYYKKLGLRKFRCTEFTNIANGIIFNTADGNINFVKYDTIDTLGICPEVENGR